MRRGLCLAGLGVLLLALLAPSGRAVAAVHPSRSFYLALGDSITYGFQRSKAFAGLPPTAYDTGYVDRVSGYLELHHRHLTTVNYGCPGEATTTVNEPCVWRVSGHALHDDYPGAQLPAALDFLRAHRPHVGVVTVALGGNDLNAFLAQCPLGDFTCLTDRAPAATAALAARMDHILGQIRAAAPRARVVVVGFYDPNIGAFAIADPLFAQLNDAVRTVTIANGGRFADVMARFNPVVDETLTICRLTLLCTESDVHPSDAGYQVIGDEVIAQLRRGSR